VSSWCCANALSRSAKLSVAIDVSRFKAVNTRDRNLTQAKMPRRLAQIDACIAQYLSQLDSADRQGEAVPEAKITRLNQASMNASASLRCGRSRGGSGQLQRDGCDTPGFGFFWSDVLPLPVRP
jgi:hypothetical protein